MPMMSNLKKRILSTTVLSLLLGFLSPISFQAPSFAASTVTKTFTVRGADDALLNGAKIRVFWNDQETGDLTYGSIATTNSSGVATVTVPQNSGNTNYVVFPASGDTTNAIKPDTYMSSSADESISIKLSLSNFVVDIQNAAGGAPGPGSVLQLPSDNSGNQNISILARGGAFGLRMSENYDPNNCYTIGLLQYVQAWSSGQNSRRYGLKVTGASGSKVYTVYTDNSCGSVLAPVGSVHVLNYNGTNINGTLKKADGTTLTLPSGAYIQATIRNDSTGSVQSNDFINSTTSPNADWHGNVTGPAGKYNVGFSIFGSLDIPSFVDSFWKNSSGGFSKTENGTYSTSSPATLGFTLPAGGPNFAFRTVLSGTSTPVSIYPLLEMKDSSNNYNFVASASSAVNNGLGSFQLNNGDYRLTVDPADLSLTTSIFTISVVAGVVTVRDSSNQLRTPTSGVYVFSPGSPNVKIKSVSAATPSTQIDNSYIEIFNGADGSGGLVSGRDTGTDSAGFNLDDGTYMVRSNPGDSISYSDKTWVLVVSGGVGTIQGLTATNGVLSLPAPSKNLLFHLNNPTDSSSLSTGWINYCLWDANTSTTSNCDGRGVDSSGNGGSSLANGTYQITVYPGSGNSLSPNKYTGTVVAGVVTGIVTSTKEPLAKDGNNRWVLSAVAANVSGTLKGANGSDFTFGQNQGVNLDVQQYINGNWQFIGMNSWRTSASWGFNITTPGRYRILANPHGYTDLAWSYGPEFWVDANRNMSTVSAAAATTGTSSLSGMNVTIRAANLKMVVTNPLDSTLLKYGWISISKRESDGSQNWIMNADIDSNNPGFAGAYLADGTYRLELNPQQNANLIAGLARKTYDATVASGVITVSFNGASVTADGNGRFGLTPASANVTGRITDQAGVALENGNNKWVNVIVQKYIAADNRWDWTSSSTQTNQDGYFNLAVTEAGKFRLRIEPNGFDNSGVSYSDEFTIAAGNESSFKIAFGSIKAAAPSLKVSVAATSGGAALQFTNIEVRKNNNWIDWAWTGNNGIASISFTEAGNYQLVATPSQDQVNLGKSRKTYNVVATADSLGNISATVTGVVAVNSVYTLSLGTGTLAGQVLANDGTTPVVNAQIVAIDQSNQQERWDYSTQSSSTGKWAMTLPQGVYSIKAKAPYGDILNGSSDVIGTVTVDAAGVATLLSGTAAIGRSAASFNITLKSPTWAGVVKAPTGSEAVIADAQVCLYNFSVWNCTNTDSTGRWALSSQSGVTSYSNDAFLVVGDYRNGTYPELRVEGPTAVAKAIGVPTGATGTTLRFVAPNVQIKVTTDGTTPVPYVWVGLDRAGFGGLGGNQTNAQGIANLYVADLTQGFNVRVDVNNNQLVAANYTSTIKNFTNSDVSTYANAHASNFATTITLDSPNLRGVVREPSVSGVAGQTSPNSWVELYLDSDNSWINGSNTDQNGVFSLNVPKPASGAEALSYTMKVNPAWNSTGTSSASQYTIKVTDANVVTVSLKGTTTAVGTSISGSFTYYQVPLAKPTVSGIVVSSDKTTGLSNSWVVPIDANTGEYYWQQGTNSQFGGAFGMSVADGAYKIQAQVPWNTPNLANSAQCSITVANGVITTSANECVQAGGTLKLALRAPNLTMTLKQNGAPVAFANVSIGLGSWQVSAQSNKDGQVFLFIDAAAIIAANPTLSGSANRFNVWVDPPYGTSNMVRWDCLSKDTTKPICSQLDNFTVAALPSDSKFNNGTVLALGNIEVLGPNTTLRVLNPITNVNIGANAWVVLYSYDTSHPEYGQSWIGGSNTDVDGYAVFNIDTSTATATTRYKVEVNPPGDQKVTLTQKVSDGNGLGLQWSDINNHVFNAGAPNAVITVKLPRGVDNNKWGWVGLEEVNASYTSTLAWVGGFGLNGDGKTSVTLGASKHYKITAYPSGGRAGTMTTCFIDTDASIVVTKATSLCGSANALSGNNLELELSLGNVTGTVLSPSGKKVANATVYANVTGASDEVYSVVTTTLENGRFGLNLDPSKNWTIKILPFNVTGAAEQLAVKTLDLPAFSAGSKAYDDIPMIVKS